jgi:hypothetical protein
MTDTNKNNELTEVQRLRRELNFANDALAEEKSAKRVTKNMDFVQVQRSEVLAISELAEKSKIALKILMLFVQVMDKGNAVMMSSSVIQELTGRSRSAISAAISILKKEKWVQVLKVGTANIYVLNSSVFWTAGANQKLYANFNAKIITSLSEQEKDLRLNQKVKLKRTPMIIPPDLPTVIEDVRNLKQNELDV